VPQNPNQQRAADTVAAWLAKNHKNPAWLVDETKADPGTIGDFLNGSRWPKLGTQGRIEEALGWPAGTIRQIGNGAEVPESLLTTSVGGDTHSPEDSELLYRRPDGLTDAEWERVKEESRGFIEWQIEKASRER
jgi:hypothetical protein